MKVLYLHIGDAKTGSSTIQSFLTKHKSELYRGGVDYVNLGLLAEGGIAQHELAFVVNRNKFEFHYKKEALYQKLNEYIQLSQCGTFIISSEGFSSLRTIDEVNELKERLPKNIKIKIISYLRRPDRWIESWYSQVVKNYPFTTARFNDFFKRHQEPAYKVVLTYSKVFTPKNMIVRVFDKRAFLKGDLIYDFCSVVGILIPNDVRLNDENISPSPKCIEILRLLNENLELDHRKRLELYKLVMINFKESKEKSFLSSEQRAEVFEKYIPAIREIEDQVSTFKKDSRYLYDK